MTDRQIEQLTAKALRARGNWVNANETVHRLFNRGAPQPEITAAEKRRDVAGAAWERAEAELATAKPITPSEADAAPEAK